MTPEEDEAWQELERKQLNKKQKENEMKNKDLLFSHWYDSLEGTKSQGFAYKAWCAGWDASRKEATMQEISDIGQEIEPVAYLMDGELFTAAEYQAIAEQGDGVQPLYAVSPKREIEQTHTDHSARHWDRTCPACNAEAEKQEPVAWVCYGFGKEKHNIDYEQEDVDALEIGTPLYTAPLKRKWQGLSDEEYKTIHNKNYNYDELARAIESKLKEKNT